MIFLLIIHDRNINNSEMTKIIDRLQYLKLFITECLCKIFQQSTRYYRMDHLTQKQLQLFDFINGIRINLNQLFQSDTQQIQPYYQQLLKLQYCLFENCNELQNISIENCRNLATILEDFNLQQTQCDYEPTQKFDVKWSQLKKNQMQNQISNPQVQSQKSVKFIQKSIKENEADKPKSFEYSKSQNKKNSSIQFVSASALPKTTSVRKKFVPPYKKPQGQQLPLKVHESISQRSNQSQSTLNPLYKNLQPKLVQVIEAQILEQGSNVKWGEIAGLSYAKKVIHQMIVWPMLRPDIFTGIRAPPKGILLFGPPGTGKTMIGRAIASQAAATFFSISASSLTSKWVGQSEKLVKTLFSVARVKQPSVIFIDQIDSLLCARSQGQQQSSRKIKTQFLIQLDGAKSNSSQRVLIIGATNRPQQLDDAVRRRFVKRLYIPLPNIQGRIQLMQTLMKDGFDLNKRQIQQLAEKTRGFSGADIYSLCSQASLIPLRKILQIQTIRQSQVPKATLQDCLQALKTVRPSINKKQLQGFKQWNSMFGSYQFTSDELENDFN